MTETHVRIKLSERAESMFAEIDPYALKEVCIIAPTLM